MNQFLVNALQEIIYNSLFATRYIKIEIVDYLNIPLFQN